MHFSYSRRDCECVPHHPVNSDKVFRFLGPGGKLHVAHGDAVLTRPQLVLVAVDKQLGQIVELWDQLLKDTAESHCSFQLFSPSSLQHRLSRLFLLIMNSYLDVSRVPLAVPPRVADAGERSIWMVELVVVGVEEKRAEGFLQAEEWRNECEKKPSVWGVLKSLLGFIVCSCLQQLLTILSIHISVE